jgi:XapX domain-containing protein
MLKIILGLIIAASIGAACRYFDVPVPAPPKLFGALLVLAITLGYIGTDLLMRGQAGDGALAEPPSAADNR